jgi:hypothetical protein
MGWAQPNVPSFMTTPCSTPKYSIGGFSTGRHWKKKATGKKKKKRFTPTVHTGKKLKTLEKKLKNLYFEHVLQLKSLNICRVWNLNMQFAGDLKRFGLESLSFICSCTIFAGFRT